jgi:uncharacterized protein YjiS (DUF1127 family)
MPALSARCSASGREWSLRGTLGAVLGAWEARRERSRSAWILSGLSDHMLIDMGISRSEAHGLVYGRPSDRQRWDDESAT